MFECGYLYNLPTEGCTQRAITYPKIDPQSPRDLIASGMTTFCSESSGYLEGAVLHLTA